MTRCLALAVVALTPLRAAPVDLLSNGGFEWGTWEWLSVWGHEGHQVVSDEAGLWLTAGQGLLLRFVE